MLIYGIHTVASFLEHKPHWVKRLYLPKNERSARQAALYDQARRHSIAVQQLDKNSAMLKKIGAANHQQVLAEIAQVSLSEKQLLEHLSTLDASHARLLILDGVQDPHNLGACLRNADAFGVSAVVVPKANSCGLTETVHRVASGASAHLPCVAVSNLSRFIDQLKAIDYWCYGFSDVAQQTIYQVEFASRCALVLGSEGQGMKSLVKKHCDYLISIPMQGAVSSLNVSAASAVALYELARQHHLAANS